jgi:hypothetical protein
MLVLSFIVSEKNRKKKMDVFSDRMTNLITYSCFYQQKKKIMKKKEFSPSLQVVFSIADRSQFEI